MLYQLFYLRYNNTNYNMYIYACVCVCVYICLLQSDNVTIHKIKFHCQAYLIKGSACTHTSPRKVLSLINK